MQVDWQNSTPRFILLPERVNEIIIFLEWNSNPQQSSLQSDTVPLYHDGFSFVFILYNNFDLRYKSREIRNRRDMGWVVTCHDNGSESDST